MGGGDSKKSNFHRGRRSAPRGPSPMRRPMPLKRCEWCRKEIERKPRQKSAHYQILRFCSRKCAADFRRFEEKVSENIRDRVK